jgi:membrane protease subunit HflK
VLRFGEVVRTEEPGLRYHLPQPREVGLLTDFTNEKKIEVGFRSAGASGQKQDVEDERRMLTGDENIVDVDFIVNWRISSAEEFLFNVRNPELTIKMASESAIREIIGRMEIQPILTEKRLEIETATKGLIQDMLDEYKAGITITRVQLLSVAPPQEVKDAFDDVTRARADGDTARNEAESYRNDILPRARGEAEKIVQEAQGYKQMIVNLAKGDAIRFESVLSAYNTSKSTTATRLYYETMEQVLGRANTMVIDGKAGGVTPYLPVQELLRKPAVSQ